MILVVQWVQAVNSNDARTWFVDEYTRWQVEELLDFGGFVSISSSTR